MHIIKQTRILLNFIGQNSIPTPIRPYQIKLHIDAHQVLLDKALY